jgi:hypothetical protein
MRVILTALIALLPAVAGAQSPGDTVEVVVPQDVNCTDFQSVLGAQGYYEAGVLLGLGDVFRLDADANGVACEGLGYIRYRRTEDDSTGHVYESWSTERPEEARCPWTDRFSVGDHVEALRRAAIDTVDNERTHDDRAECLHVLGEIQQLGN